MRDDLHRGAPVSRRWASVIRRLARDADWRDEGPRAVAAALAGDLNEQVSAGFLRDARDAVASGAVPLPGADPAAWLGRALSQLEHDTARALMRDQQRGAPRESAVARALGVAAVQHVDAVARQLSAHVLGRSPKDHPEFASRARQVLDQAVTRQTAAQRALGEHVPIRQPRLGFTVDFPIGAQ